MTLSAWLFMLTAATVMLFVVESWAHGRVGDLALCVTNVVLFFSSLMFVTALFGAAEPSPSAEVMRWALPTVLTITAAPYVDVVAYGLAVLVVTGGPAARIRRIKGLISGPLEWVLSVLSAGSVWYAIAEVVSTCLGRFRVTTLPVEGWALVAALGVVCFWIGPSKGFCERATAGYGRAARLMFPAILIVIVISACSMSIALVLFGE